MGQADKYHSYEKITVPMYVCMYVCMYVYMYAAIRRPHVHHAVHVCVHILQFSKDRQHRLHVNSNCSSPKQEPVPDKASQQVINLENSLSKGMRQT